MPALGAAPSPGQEAPRTSAFASPREVMAAFLRYFDYKRGRDPGGLQAAASTLDLSEVPAEKRAERGVWIVEQRLGRILDRIRVVELAEFPDAAALSGVDHWTWIAKREEPPPAQVELSFARLPGGGWLIDPVTIARLDNTWNEVKGLPILGALAGAEGGLLTLPEWIRLRVPASLKGGGLLLEPYQWLGLVVLIVLGLILERAAILILRPLMVRLGEKQQGGSIDRKLLGNFERPVSMLVVVGTVWVGLSLLDIESSIVNVLDLAASFVLAVAGVWATYRLVDVFSWFLAQKAARTENTFDDMLVPLLRRTLKVLVVIVGIVFVASRLTGDLWGIFAGLSIGSLAVGFAAKDSIENLFGTFTVLLDKPFKLGDVVKIGDIEGTVEDVGFRSTRVRTAEDSLITVPNSRFIASHVDNLGARRYRRTNLTLALTYDTPAQKVEAFCEGVRELLRAHPLVRKDAYFAWFHEFGATSLDVRVVFFIVTADFGTDLREKHRLYCDILRLAERLQVAFAFPTQTIHIAKPEDLVHKNTPRDQEEALLTGRALAREIAAASLAPLAGRMPPTMRFDPADPDLGLRPSAPPPVGAKS